MTYPRAHLVDADNGGFYHCISRCVRRGWLCGQDAVSGRSFEHRRDWVEARMLELDDLFAVNLFGYAVMSNHYHCVVEVVPGRAARWSDGEVARRWCTLCPGSTEEETALKRSALLGNRDRLTEVRARLASLSWFMRFINEPIARRANCEDSVTGRFWEGRFESVALLDEAAVVACIAYVDLNPVRARTASRAQDAQHTSIARRVGTGGKRSAPLAPLSALSLTLAEYRSPAGLDGRRTSRRYCIAAGHGHRSAHALEVQPRRLARRRAGAAFQVPGLRRPRVAAPTRPVSWPTMPAWRQAGHGRARLNQNRTQISTATRHATCSMRDFPVVVE